MNTVGYAVVFFRTTSQRTLLFNISHKNNSLFYALFSLALNLELNREEAL